MIVSDRVRAAQIRSIYRNTPPGMLGMAAALSCYIAALAYIDAVEISKAFVFVGLLALQAGGRLLLYRAHSRDPDADFFPARLCAHQARRISRLRRSGAGQ